MAAEVFGRGPDFDHRIDAPPGTFVPVFEKRLHAQTPDTAIDGLNPDISVKISWPSVLILPLRNLSVDPELDFWGIGLAAELADELNRYPDYPGDDPRLPGCSEYGPAWSMLARLYADIYAFDISGIKDPLKKAFEFVQNGTRLSPDNQR